MPICDPEMSSWRIAAGCRPVVLDSHRTKLPMPQNKAFHTEMTRKFMTSKKVNTKIVPEQVLRASSRRVGCNAVEAWDAALT